MDTYTGSNQPKVSVIVPTKNSANYLHFCLLSMHQQTYKNIEIIVVDNYSTDNTCDIAKRFGARVFTRGKERAVQLNFGVAMARGKYVFETGSDMMSEPTYIEEAVAKCEEGYDAIYSSVISKPSKNFWCKVKALERLSYIGDDQIEAAHFFKYDVFVSLGGADPSLISVEEDLQHRLDEAGFKTGRIKAREIHLHEMKTLKEVWLKSFYYGSYMRSYLKKHPKRGSQYLFPIRKAFLKNILLYSKHPILSIGFILYKVVQQTAGLCGLLVNKDIHERIYGESSTH